MFELSEFGEFLVGVIIMEVIYFEVVKIMEGKMEIWVFMLEVWYFV